MSWIRSSKGLALVVLIALALAAAGTAGAYSISDETTFNESRVGERVNTTVVIEDPFEGTPNDWTLRASTELRNVSWVVTTYQQGTQINQSTYGGQEFTQNLSIDNGGDEVAVEVSGETPPVENFTYAEPETYTLWDLDALTGDSENDLNATQIHHYTNDSKDARQAIDEAVTAVNESGNADARNTLNNSISAYNNDNFGNAIDLANQAQNQAEQAEQSQQRTQTLIYAAVAVLVLALVGGGIYYWQSQQEEYGKLQ